MKNTTKLFYTALVVIFASSGALAQQDAKRVEDKPKAVTETVKKGPFDSNASEQRTDSSAKKAKDQKVSVWSVVPTDGFVPTGNAEADKKSKLEIQRRWIKDHPKEFEQLLKAHNLRVKPKEVKRHE